GTVVSVTSSEVQARSALAFAPGEADGSGEMLAAGLFDVEGDDGAAPRGEVMRKYTTMIARIRPPKTSARRNQYTRGGRSPTGLRTPSMAPPRTPLYGIEKRRWFNEAM